MENPNIKTKLQHSQSKDAYNIIGTGLGLKYKIARIPYLKIEGNEVISRTEKNEALRHAVFINECFNRSEDIVNFLDKKEEYDANLKTDAVAKFIDYFTKQSGVMIPERFFEDFFGARG